MATYSNVRLAKTVSAMTPSTEDIVNFQSEQDALTVTNWGASGVIWVRADGGHATVAGDDCVAVLPSTAVTWSTPRVTTVSLISSSAASYNVVGQV